MTNQQIAQQVRAFYLNRLYRLSPKGARHFCLRLYRLHQDDTVLMPLKIYYGLNKYRWTTALKKINNPQYRIKEEQRLLKCCATFSKPQRERAKYYRQNPGVLFNEYYLERLFFARSLNLHQGVFAPYFKRGINYFKKINYAKYLWTPESLEYDNYFAANTVYYLQDLKIIDLEKEFISAWKKHFFSARDEEKHQYWNKIYGLTHIILAASRYYQKFVSPKKYAWIIKYFEAHIDEILKTAHLDIIAEVGLCLLLAKQKKSPALRKIRAHLRSKYNPKYGYFTLKQNKNIRICAHTNIIAYMTLVGFEQLYKGPDLSKAKLNGKPLLYIDK